MKSRTAPAQRIEMLNGDSTNQLCDFMIWSILQWDIVGYMILEYISLLHDIILSCLKIKTKPAESHS